MLDSICVFRISLFPAAVAPVPLPLQYARDGFVILKQALTSDQLTAARAECDLLCAKIGSDRCACSHPFLLCLLSSALILILALCICSS